MNIEQWIQLISLAYEKTEMQFSQEKKDLLLSEYSEEQSNMHTEIIAEAGDVLFDYFFAKASKGETFGNIQRIKAIFGNTIEENYGLSTGPFIDIAKTYWTYKIEVGDLSSKDKVLFLIIILNEVEALIASLFFPTPGPKEIPVNQRKEKQKEILEEFAPEIDVERFLQENPMLREHKEKVESPETLKRYCYERIYELAKIYETTLSSRMEYEQGFFHVMSTLNVPKSKWEEILLEVKLSVELGRIPYHRLSPVNQYIMTVRPYLWYCLENHPPEDFNPEDVGSLEIDVEFTQYIDKLARSISQKVKGALWAPGSGCLGSGVFILVACITAPLIIFFLLKQFSLI